MNEGQVAGGLLAIIFAGILVFITGQVVEERSIRAKMDLCLRGALTVDMKNHPQAMGTCIDLVVFRRHEENQKRYEENQK